MTKDTTQSGCGIRPMPLSAVIENIVTLLVAAGLSAFLVWWTDSLLGLFGLLVLLNVNTIKTSPQPKPLSKSTASNTESSP